MMKPSIGRIVHYVLDSEDVNRQSAVGRHRPAVVTEVVNADSGLVNLVVTLDGPNDGAPRGAAHPSLWVGTRSYSETAEPGTWHWPERVD